MRSRVKVGDTVVAFARTAALPAGLVTNDQLYVSGSPSGSELALPFNVMGVPGRMLPWSGPALAMGVSLGAVELPHSPQPLTPKIAVITSRATHDKVLPGLRSCISMHPLFRSRGQ